MDRKCLADFCNEISNPLEIPVIAGVFLLKSYKNALFINKFVPGANIPENILNRLKDAKNPLQEGILIASEQAKILLILQMEFILWQSNQNILSQRYLKKLDSIWNINCLLYTSDAADE